MKINLKIWSIFLLWLLIMHSYSSKAQNSQLPDKDSTIYSLQLGEELTYIVKYAFFNLGEIKFNIADKSNINGISVTKTIAYMDSYEGLPFVDLHQIYYSNIDSNFCPVEFLGLMLEEDTSYVRYTFEGDSLIKIKKGNYNTKAIKLDSSAVVEQKFQDGLSILFLARKHSGDDTTKHIACFVNEKEETTIINFYSESEPVEIDQIDYDVDCVKIDGQTDFVSVYGLTGQFEGWFSNDKHAVPILAKMNVIVGSVTLELIDWKKENWNPPKYIN